MNEVINAAGRRVPTELEGKALRPFAGAHADCLPEPRRAAGGPSRTPPGRGCPDKLVRG